MDQLTDVLAAMSHPSRRLILDRLAKGPAGFLEIARMFDTALNAVTKHLKLLERAGLITRERRGREVIISLRAQPMKDVAEYVHHYQRFWDTHLDRFQQHFMDAKRHKEKKT